jgi:hypothetical protein
MIYRSGFILLLISLLLTTSFSRGQSPDPSLTTPDKETTLQRAEDVAEDNETDLTPWLDELELRRQHPLNLNKATAEELKELMLLNDLQIINLIRHREKLGPLLDIHELQSIDGFDLTTVEQILPYVTVNDPVIRLSPGEIIRRGNSHYFLRLQTPLDESRGFSPQQSHYPGSALKIYSRYRFHYYNHIRVGITAEKDPGEQFFRGDRKDGFDFYSAHFLLKNTGRIKALALGDYQLQFAQGLVMWSGLSFGKGADAINIRKGGVGIQPYSSVDENRFMRGIAITIPHGAIEYTGFFSRKKRDAGIAISDTLPDELTHITSLQQSGLHRTVNELNARHAVTETFTGGNITLRKNRWHVGVTGYFMHLSLPLQKDLSFYNRYDFTGNQGWNNSLDYSFTLHNIHVFGETALGSGKGMATLNGAIISLHPKVSLSLLHRWYSPRYHSFLGAAFSENTRVTNETGVYIGLNARLAPRMNLYAFADHFSFPWMKYRTYSPTRGFDYLVQLNYRPDKKTNIELRYRSRNKPINDSAPSLIVATADAIRQSVRLQLSYPVMEAIILKNRLEWVDYYCAGQHQRGFLIYQDVIYRPMMKPLNFTLRYALFDTESYNARIYAYENDVLYAWSFPFYSGKGHRAYLLTAWQINHFFTLQLRYSQTIFAIGTRENSHEVKFQMRVKF